MKQLSENPFPSVKALQQAKELETYFYELLSARGPLDPHVQHLSHKIRDCYEKVILADHAFAETHDVEHAVWNLHYKQIEAFRSLFNHSKITSTVADAERSSGNNIKRGGQRILSPGEQELALFTRFLEKAMTFYHDLILKLRAKYGLSLDLSDVVRIPGKDESKAVELKRCQLSCHKCFVCLGDYARYKEYYSRNEAGSCDFSVAAGFYQKAVFFWPSIGQPHNQLAVLATYAGDEVLAVYRTFRSLAIEKPFPTARENLTIIFEKNRLKCHQLYAAAGTALPLSKWDNAKVAKAIGTRAPNLAKKNGSQEASDELLNTFRIRFVRLNGILFTKTSLETFQEVCSAMLYDLERLLALDNRNVEELLVSGYGVGMETGNPGVAGVLQLISILICTVQNISWGSNGKTSTYAEVLQRAVLFQHAITVSLEIVGRIISRCAVMSDPSNSPLLPAILVFLEWIACRPEIALGVEADEKQLNAWSLFWKQCVLLLNRFCHDLKWSGDLNNTLEASFEVNSLGNSEIGIALWEDYELQGFSPLAAAHLALDFSKRQSSNGMGTKKEKHVRLQRLLAAGKAIVNVLKDSGSGILYDEDLKKFSLIGEMPQRKSHVDELDGGLNAEIHRSVAMSSNNVATALKNKAALVTVLPTKQAPRQDEDEELIVFKPALRGHSLMTSCTPIDHNNELPIRSTVSPVTQLLDSAPNITGEHKLACDMKDRSSFSRGWSDVSNILAPATNLGNGFMDSSVVKMACHPSAVSAFSSGVDSRCVNTSNVPRMDLTNISPSCSPVNRHLSAQDWLNQTGISSMHITNGTVSTSVGMLPQGLLNSAGVIGHPKRLIPETIGNCAGQGLGDPYKHSVEGVDGAKQYHPALNLPLGLTSFSNVQSIPVTCEKLSEKVQKNLYTSANSKIVKSTDGTSSLSKGSCSLASAVIRPPPGFGPRPINPKLNVESIQGGSKSLQAHDEQQTCDDYSWLDDHKSSNLRETPGEKHMIPSGCSADYSLWSSGVSVSVQPGAGAFPFPMMQPSQVHNLQEQTQHSSIWLSQQHLENHMIKKLGPCLEQQSILRQSFLNGNQPYYSYGR